MNLKFYLILPALTSILLSCNKDKKEKYSDLISEHSIDSLALVFPEESEQKVENQNMEIPEPSKIKYDHKKIKKIDQKKEMRTDGNFNQMTIFEVNKDISTDQLKDYCSSIKPNYTSGYFQILVFFKNPYTARFPDNPVTGLYMEEGDLRNIKAIYTINNMNGYSKLNYYEKNNWESTAQTTEIN